MGAKLPRDIQVMVVDDMPSIRTMVMDTLRALGFKNIDSACDGNDAFQKMSAKAINGEPYKLLMSDIMMPNCNGIELVKQLRDTIPYAELPIIMVSSEAEIATIMQAIDAGANNYVLKPFTAEILKEKIMAVFYPPKKD